MSYLLLIDIIWIREHITKYNCKKKIVLISFSKLLQKERKRKKKSFSKLINVFYWGKLILKYELL
jgi:hypothetical protein